MALTAFKSFDRPGDKSGIAAITLVKTSSVPDLDAPITNQVSATTLYETGRLAIRAEEAAPVVMFGFISCRYRRLGLGRLSACGSRRKRSWRGSRSFEACNARQPADFPRRQKETVGFGLLYRLGRWPFFLMHRIGMRSGRRIFDRLNYKLMER